MRIDLHIHSEHSFDSNTSIKSIVRRAEEMGLGAIAITDHDTMSACRLARKIARKVTIIPGMEITCEGGTHLIGLFLKDEINSRNIFEVMDEIHSQGGLAVMPHPYRPRTGLVFGREKERLFDGEEFARIMTRIDLVETVNFHDKPEDVVAADRWSLMHPDLPRVAGSDAHLVHEIGHAYVELEEVKSESLDDIKRALLYSPRLIRYEAYTHEQEWIEKTSRSLGRKRSLIFRTKNLVPAVIRKSFRRIYERSAGKIRTEQNHPTREIEEARRDP
nr:PHP domain-containing protein [candidate division Zixibacteria bacterium]